MNRRTPDILLFEQFDRERLIKKESANKQRVREIDAADAKARHD